jgi:hypothetical protein
MSQGWGIRLSFRASVTVMRLKSKAGNAISLY